VPLAADPRAERIDRQSWLPGCSKGDDDQARSRVRQMRLAARACHGKLLTGRAFHRISQRQGLGLAASVLDRVGIRESGIRG
jgi:hypothetical protein